MTTHDQHTDTTTPVPATDRPQSEGSERVETDQAATQAGPVTTADESAEPSAQPSKPSAAVEKPEDSSLLADNDLPGLRSRWDDVQASFVDDPRACVQKADTLVADVVQQLTAGFSDARSRLEAQWARGEEASTEELRQALKRYRVFFERLLAA
jgi:hypothetical protein